MAYECETGSFKIKFDIGRRVFLILNNGLSYEGIIKSFNPTSQRMRLTDLIQHPGHIVVDGFRNFELSEIKDLKNLEEPVVKSEGASSSARHLKITHSIPVIEGYRKQLTEADTKKILDLQNYFRYIDNKAPNFFAALTEIQNSQVIGVHAKDTSKGRLQRASVIVIATENNVYIFDLKVLGDSVFDKGLKTALESPTITKVVHDCRLLSDCLHHKHQISLVNVRDIEAEDIINVYQERGCIRNHTRSFGYLVEVYLGIPADTLGEGHLKQDWSERPLSVENQKSLAVYASLLVPLHKAVEERYIQRLRDASKIYSDHMRDSDMYDLVTTDPKLVLRDELINLVKTRDTPRRTDGRAVDEC